MWRRAKTRKGSCGESFQISLCSRLESVLWYPSELLPILQIVAQLCACNANQIFLETTPKCAPDYFWITFGLRLDYFWITFGQLSLDSLPTRIFAGLLLDYFWNTFGLLLGYFWNTFGLPSLDSLAIRMVASKPLYCVDSRAHQEHQNQISI